ncbi:penicillin-binding protein 2 [Patescibacteria group bacterium]|nr:penicillin-binding protein 2 [Patescibacteria group bacterium]
MTPNSVFRIRLIAVGVGVVVLFFIVRLYLLQIVSGDDFRQRAERQYLRPNQEIYDRGSIFFKDADGTAVGAAILKTGYTLGINPKALDNAPAVWNKLNAVVPIDQNDFLTRAAQKTQLYSVVAKKLDEAAATKISELKIPGVLIYKDRYRYYPFGSLAANTVGLVGYQGDILAGRYGLERYYDGTLSRDDSNLYSNLFAEIFSGIEKTVDSKSKFEGDVVTSIEPTVEAELEKELASVQKKWNSRLSGGIIMDPKTGEIFAMGVSPTFDPNNLQNESDPAVFSNPLVENVYEMGSIIKSLTMAAGIDSGAVTATTTYDDTGFIEVNGSRIENWDGGLNRGVVDMQVVLNESLNTGASFVAQKMGSQLFSDYFRRFGLGEDTGIDLPNETPGLIDNLNSPRDVEHDTASFGQGIAMTPIITIRALASLANGGYLVTPHLATRIDYKIGLSKDIAPERGPQVIKSSTDAEITRMLVNLVDNALLNGTVKMAHYSIAAKTGTAQIADRVNGGYYKDRYLHSFFGYFPAHNPRFIVLLYTVEPKGVGGDFASYTLTPPFMDIAKFLINYYKIPPDR